MLEVIAYTGGWNAPSRVFRVQNYQEPLRAFGIAINECPSSAGLYPPIRKWLRPAWAAWNLLDRAPDTLRSYTYDVVLLQREMLSTYVTWEPFTKKPRVFDVDDAIWLHPRGGFAEKLARMCDHIICGNEFLAEQFSRWNPKVTILPTSVNVSVFRPRETAADGDRPIIGWMGLHSGFRYLATVEKAIARVLHGFPNAIFRVVSSQRPHFPDIPAHQFEWIPWTQENEAGAIREMTIGIMPLDDSEYALGKCSYKMLLYLASGLPVVVSPVAMNGEILRKGKVGFGPQNEEEWVEALSELVRNPQLCEAMGKIGRDLVVREFSVETLAPRLARVLSGSVARSLKKSESGSQSDPEYENREDMAQTKSLCGDCASVRIRLPLFRGFA